MLQEKTIVFVPDLVNYSKEYSDTLLCEMWGITQEEWNYIDSRISAIGGDE